MIEIILVAVVFYGGGYLLIKWLENLNNSGNGSLLYPIEKESNIPLKKDYQESEKKIPSIGNDKSLDVDVDYDTYIRSMMKSGLNSDSKQALQARVYETFDTFGKEWLEDINIKLLASMDFEHNRDSNVIERDKQSNMTLSDYHVWVEEAFLNWFTKNAETLGVSRIDKDAYIDHLKKNGCDMAFTNFIKINNKPNPIINTNDYLSIISSLKSQSSLELPEIENINFDSTETIKLIQVFLNEAKQSDKNDRELLNTVHDILTQSSFVLSDQFWENNLYILHKIALNFKDYISAQKFASQIYSISNESTYAYQAYGEAALYDALKFKQSIGESLDFYNMRPRILLPDVVNHMIKQIEVNHHYKEEKEIFYKIKSLVLLSIALHKINDSEFGDISKSLFTIAKSQATKALPMELGFGNLPFNEKEFIYSSWDVVENTWLEQ